MEGSVVGGRYEVVRELGRGGMGTVYEARHLGTGRRVAVKVITADISKSPGLLHRFEVEARAGGGIDSQYIAQVFDTGRSEGGAPYIVMEYLDGEDLFQLIGRIAPIPVPLALRIIAQACLGLEKAHQAKIIHRDIKPANIFLTEREGDEVGVKILDFGVAKIRAEEGQNITSLTRTGSLLGSPLYMSPEQARGDKNIDHRSDVWSLGIVLYEQLCGVTPFHEIEGLGSLIIAICGESPTPIQRRAQWVPPEVATILHKALAQKPADRFSSAYEMYRAIKAVIPTGTTTIDKATLVPLTSAQRGYVAPPMTATEPALSSSAPGLEHGRSQMASFAELSRPGGGGAFPSMPLPPPPRAPDMLPGDPLKTQEILGGVALLHESVPPPPISSPGQGPGLITVAPIASHVDQRVVVRSIRPPVLYGPEPDAEDTELVGIESTMRAAGSPARGLGVGPGGTLQSAIDGTLVSPSVPPPGGPVKLPHIVMPAPSLNAGLALAGPSAVSHVTPPPPPPASHEAARTTAGVTSEEPKPAAKRSVASIVAAVVALIGLSVVAGFAGTQLAGRAVVAPTAQPTVAPLPPPPVLGATGAAMPGTSNSPAPAITAPPSAEPSATAASSSVASPAASAAPVTTGIGPRRKAPGH